MDRNTRLLQNFLFSAKNLKQSLWIIPLFLIPLLFMIGLVQAKHSRLKTFSDQIDHLERKAALLCVRQSQRNEIVARIKKRGPNYLSQSVETISLLTPELQRVRALARHYPENPALQERLSFLQGEKNKIRFIEVAPHQFKLQHSVQMNSEDLKNFLLAVEGESYSGIQIQELSLKKEREKSDEWVYTLQATLIQKNL